MTKAVASLPICCKSLRKPHPVVLLHWLVFRLVLSWLVLLPNTSCKPAPRHVCNKWYWWGWQPAVFPPPPSAPSCTRTRWCCTASTMTLCRLLPCSIGRARNKPCQLPSYPRAGIFFTGNCLCSNGSLCSTFKHKPRLPRPHAAPVCTAQSQRLRSVLLMRLYQRLYQNLYQRLR